MASKRAIARAARRAAMDEAAVADMAEALFVAKRRVYRRSLLELARSLGVEVSRPELSAEVERDLRADALRRAKQIARTHNRDLVAALPELTEGERDADLDAKIRTWRIARQRKRGRATAANEVYPAHTDALVAGARDLGIGPDAVWDFGGHPELGDSPPVCEICQTLAALGPWTTAQVAAIGNPHPACRQDWRLRASIDERDVVQEPLLGQRLGGVLGTEPLVMRAGSREAAVDQIVALKNE
jgi:hypothetical protein